MSSEESELVTSLKRALQTLPNGPHDTSAPDHGPALALAQQLVKKLERPQDLIRRIGYEAHSQQLCLRLAIDLKLFHILTHSPHPITSTALAKTCGAEEILVTRIMRVLTAINFAAEKDTQLYIPTSASHAMTDPAQESMVRSASDDTVQIFARLPQALQERGYRCPTDALDCPLQWTMGIQGRYFDWVAQNPQQAGDLVVSMKAMHAGSTRQQWFDFYPVQERLLDGWCKDDEDGSGILLVDMGGGNGYDLKCLVERFSLVAAHADKLVLQDLPEVVAAIDKKALPGIQMMGGNFFDLQPIQGARAYYTHRVLHNWADAQARTILQNVRDAMCPGYSRLLLNETILPDKGCSVFHAAGDMNMMGILGGIKRTTSQWMQLLSSVGLVLENIWMSADLEDLDGILEVSRME